VARTFTSLLIMASRGRATSTRPDGDPPARRADAARNIATIIDAATELFSGGRTVSMSDVARAAGVGRVTLYAHFPSRDVLLDAVLDHAIAGADRAFATIPMDEGAADEALTRLARSSWQILNQYRSLRANTMDQVGAQRLRERHDPALARVERLIARGQDDGVFRTDLPRDWLVTTFYSLLHAAADDANAGRLNPTAVPDILEATLRSVLAPPS
jgi:AcrR family transcriptional regulator